MGDIKFEKLIAGTVVLLTILLIFWGYLYTSHYERLAKEAIKAGLVQQPLSNGGSVWIKAEDYKPYPISSFDAPRWNR